MTWHYLSFADSDLPAGKQFLGACIVDGDDFIDAVRNSWRLGCNHGGECLGLELTGEPPFPHPANRLLSKADLEACGPCVSADDLPGGHTIQ